MFTFARIIFLSTHSKPLLVCYILTHLSFGDPPPSKHGNCKESSAVERFPGGPGRALPALHGPPLRGHALALGVPGAPRPTNGPQLAHLVFHIFLGVVPELLPEKGSLPSLLLLF